MVRTIKGGITDLHSVVSGLNNRILLGMEAATELMSLSRRNPSFLPEATNLQAMLQSGRSPVVTGRQYLFVFDKHSANLPSQAGRSLSNEMSDIHEIFFPRGALGGTLFFLFLFQGRATNGCQKFSRILKSEARNPKSETNSKNPSAKLRTGGRKGWKNWSFGLEFTSSFEF